MPRHSFKGGKMMMMVRGGLTEPAAWIRVIAEVVIESGSMSEFARFGGYPASLPEGLDIMTLSLQGTTISMSSIN